MGVNKNIQIDLKSWPSVEGRFTVGNKKSPVAVCTNATVAGIELDKEKVAIYGKCVTENIGIEKIIQNVVSNPYIRFLILCGKVSKGHFVGQAFISLKNNGIDEQGKIIGAKGNMPYLKGIDKGLIERFRKQVTLVDLTGEDDAKIIMEKVEACWKENQGVFNGEALEIAKIKEIEAKPSSEWLSDPKGFFVISIDKIRNKLLVEHYQENRLKNKIIGDSAEDISKTIAKLNLIGDFGQTLEHAIYLGRELQKAEIALKNNLDYEQDKEIKIKKVVQKQTGPAQKDEYGWFD